MNNNIDLINRSELLDKLLKSGAIGEFAKFIIEEAPAVCESPFCGNCGQALDWSGEKRW